MRKSYQWLINNLLEIKWPLILSLFLLLIEALLNFLAVYLQKYLIDEAFLQKNISLFFELIVYLSLALLGSGILFTLSPYHFLKNQNTLRYKLTSKLLIKFYALPISNLQNYKKGDIIHYFSNDIEQVSNTTSYFIPKLIQEVFVIVLTAIIIYSINPYIFLINFILIALYLIVIKKNKNKLITLSNLKNQCSSELTSFIEEGIASTREVISYNSVDFETNQYKNIFQRLFNLSRKEILLQIKIFIISDPLKWGIYLTIFGIGGYLLSENYISVGSFVIAYQLSSYFIDSCTNSFNLINTIFSSSPNFSRLNAMFDENEQNNGKESVDKIFNISFDNALLSPTENIEMPNNYIKTTMIPIGKKIAIIGESGSGKSTFANILIDNNFKLDVWTVRVNGIEISKINKKEYYKRVSIVKQDPFFFQGTIWDNITLGVNHPIERVWYFCEIVCIDTLIKTLPLKLNERISEGGLSLSGGERQRIALVRALLREPEVLILDEATSALDYKLEEKIMLNIENIRNDRTTIIISHRIAPITNSDIIYIFENGKIIAQGKHEYLRSESKEYRRMLELDSYVEV